jgi:hypothetical protein
LAVPTAKLTAHQAQLKQALLASSRPTENNLKHTWRILMRKKKFLIPGMATVMVAMALVVSVVVQTQRPVSAAELTQQSIAKVSALTTDERKALDVRLNGDAQSELQAALKAKDLKVLSYEEFKKQNPHGNAANHQLPSGHQADTPDMTKLRYLVYSSADGTQRVIGVDEANLPVFMMAHRTNGDGSQQGSVMMLNDNGQPGTSAAGSHEASAGGSTQCTMASGSDKPVCTSTGDAPAPTCTHESDGNMKCTTSTGGSSQQ